MSTRDRSNDHVRCHLHPPRTHVRHQGMVQFPEDVKLNRDALALLGHIASVETSGHTFLTSHKLYLGVIATLQRHTADVVVAVSAGMDVRETDLGISSRRQRKVVDGQSGGGLSAL